MYRPFVVENDCINYMAEHIFESYCKRDFTIYNPVWNRIK